MPCSGWGAVANVTPGARLSRVAAPDQPEQSAHPRVELRSESVILQREIPHTARAALPKSTECWAEASSRERGAYCPVARGGARQGSWLRGGGVGGGGGVLLLGGRGVGKSTLLLEVPPRAAGTGLRVLYVTAEESLTQVRLRADRTRAIHAELFVAAETDLAAILGHINDIQPGLLIVDSVQTVASSLI